MKSPRLTNEDLEPEGSEDWPKVTAAGDSESHVLTTVPSVGASLAFLGGKVRTGFQQITGRQ